MESDATIKGPYFHRPPLFSTNSRTFNFSPFVRPGHFFFIALTVCDKTAIKSYTLLSSFYWESNSISLDFAMNTIE